MWALVKNLETRKLKRVRSTELYVLDGYHMKPFKPQNHSDFKKKTEYGRVQDKYMVLHYILALCDNEEELNEMLNDPKQYGIHNPTRLSSGPPKSLFSLYTLSQEKANVISQKEQTKQAADKQKKSPADRIIGKVLSKEPSSSKQTSHSSSKINKIDDSISSKTVGNEGVQTVLQKMSDGKAQANTNPQSEKPSNNDCLKMPSFQKKGGGDKILQKLQSREASSKNSVGNPSLKRGFPEDTVVNAAKVSNLLQVVCFSFCETMIKFPISVITSFQILLYPIRT